MLKTDSSAYKKALSADRMEAHGTESSEEIAELNYKKFDRAWKRGHETYVSEAKKYDEFYRGEQWSAEDKSKLEIQSRPALTVNMILPTINTVIGEQTTSRVDVQFKPKRTGKDDIAHALTRIWLHVSDDQDFSNRETQVFTDGLVQDRGYFDMRINFEDHMEGEVSITAEDPTGILPDPDGKDYDPKTWNIVQKTYKLTIEEIKGVYGHAKADKLRALIDNEQTLGPDSVQMQDSTFSEDTKQYDAESFAEDAIVKGIKTVRLIESQFIKMSRVKCFVDPETGDTRNIPITWDEEKIERFRQSFGLLVHTKMAKRVRWTVSADRILLHDAWSPYKTFTIIPYFPYFRRGRPFGMVRNLINPQEMVNKISSQELHVINTTANSGWTVEAGSLTNMTVDELETRGAETGLVIEHRKGSAAPAKIQPNTIPTGLDRIGLKSIDNLKQISGVSDSMLGSEGAEVSGVALENKQTRGKIQIQVPMQNLARTRKMVANKMLELVQHFYTEPRIFRITDFRAGDKQEEVAINQELPEGGIMNNLTIGEYDAVITTMPARDNFQDQQFAEILALREVGVIVPDDEVVKQSHLYEKGRIAEKMLQLAGMGEPSEMELAEMERQNQVQAAMDQLQVAKLEAEVANLEAQAELHYAKANDTANSDNMELAALEAELQKTREELELRMRLARISAANKTTVATIGGHAKLAEKEVAGRTQLAAAQANAARGAAAKPSSQ